MKQGTRFRLLAFLLFALCQPLLANDGFEVVSINPYVVTGRSVVQGPATARMNDYDRPCFIMHRYVDSANYYLSSGAEGDTFVTYFKPLASCSLLFVEHQMYDGGMGTAFLWEPNPEWLAAFPNGRAVRRTGQTISPLGKVIAGPQPFGSGGFEWVTFFDENNTDIMFGDTSNAEVPDGQAHWRNGFLAGWVKNGETPHPLADHVGARGFTYTWFGGPWTYDYEAEQVEWGYYNVIIENMIDVGLLYPFGSPPLIQNVSTLPNTIGVDASFEVTADILDEDGWTPVDEFAYLHYEFVDTAEGADTIAVFGEDSVLMTQIIPDTQKFAGLIDLADAGLQAGAQVRYWVSCWDNSDGYNSTAESKQAFDLLSLHAPEAYNLWIDDGQFSSTYSYFHSLGVIDNDDPADDWFEVWDAAANRGFDANLINAYPWDLILYTGNGSVYMPFRDSVETSLFADYLHTDGDLIYIDQNYFGVNSFESSSVFQSGEFAYDVFGIATGSNDPDADTLFEGEGSDAISAAFPVNSPFALVETDLNRADYITLTGSATDWFYGWNDGNTYGSINPTAGGGCAHYLGFNVTLANVEQFEAFYHQLLVIYYRIGSAPEQSLPAEWSLSPAWPNPFNPSTRVSFSVPEAGHVILEVFDITGRRVTTLQEGVLSAGRYAATFNGKNLASGVYLVRLRGEGFSAARRIVLLK